MISALVQALRPKQWTKNLLVLLAPLAAGSILDELPKITIGIIGFILASILGYLVNDWRDRPFDKLHHFKKNRPFASGRLTFKHLASLVAVSFVGIVLCCVFLPIQYRVILGIYLIVTISYSLGIKNIPVVELIFLSSGFLIRAIAGSAIIDTPPTGWFIVSVLFGALSIVSTKRIAEIKVSPLGLTRKVSNEYSVEFLRTILGCSLSITLLTYALWVFEVHSGSTWIQFTILPFTTFMLLFAHQSEIGNVENPETLLFKNPILMISCLLTILPIILVTYR